MEIHALCVFCSSSNLVPEDFRDDAIALADRMAEENITLIYGGGSVGLMGVLADHILDRGGKVIGVIPEFLRTSELAHDGLTEMIVTRSMHERKIEMSRRADAFAVLPGGFGTLDEFFEILTWKQLGLHERPIVVANTGSWFDPILSYFRQAENQRLISRENLALIEVVDSGKQIVDALMRRQDLPGALPRLSRS
jgi:uncharacterized protein (TIGR00730 family)